MALLDVPVEVVVSLALWEARFCMDEDDECLLVQSGLVGSLKPGMEIRVSFSEMNPVDSDACRSIV